MKKFITLIALLFWSVSVFAQTHTVARGESLQSIAAKYNITEAQLLAANPGADKLFYVGLKLNIPESVGSVATTTTTSTANSTYGTAVNQMPSQPVATNQNSDKKRGRIDSEGNLIRHSFFVKALYEMNNFDYAKESSWYGVGMSASSIAHWGAFHVGGDLAFLINAGVVKDWGCCVEFGPSARVDITENIFINMPIDVVCVVSFDKGNSHASWGGRLAPALHLALSDSFGIFAGPQMNFAFASGSKAAFGMVAGIAFQF
ncbi:MAG: LysM peptidoglycan-binding domain-containing protein [Muribaculaceae bacterium]|nr:LysM peptidoglycan-binding domain-containing protein [Muribaculaceae bacterium]